MNQPSTPYLATHPQFGQVTVLGPSNRGQDWLKVLYHNTNTIGTAWAAKLVAA